MPPEAKDIRVAFFAVAYSVQEGTVDVWELRKTLANELAKYEAKYKTIIDRNYSLTREGSGRYNTKYSAIPLDKSKLPKKAIKQVGLDDEGELDEEKLDEQMREVMEFLLGTA